MKKFFELIIRYPRATIVATLLLTVFFGWQLEKVRIEADPDAYLPGDHPAVLYRELVHTIFSYQEPMVVAVFNDGPDGIFNPRTLAKIKRITQGIAEVRYVIAQRDEDVKSISSLDNIIGTAEGIDVIPIMEEVPSTPEEMESLKENIYGNDMFVGWLVSEDGTAAMVQAKIENNQEKQKYAYGEIKKIVEREKGDGDRIYIAGQPVLKATFVEYIVKSINVMLPFIIGVIIVLLYILFGSVRGVALPLLVVVASAIWCVGLMGLVGVPVYDLTTITPVILIAMGSADGIHILNRYYEEAAANGSRGGGPVVLETMLTTWPPIVMTSITTAIGFGSLLSSRLVPVRSFGLFTGVGIICALLFSLTFIPAGLMLMKLPDLTVRRTLNQRVNGAIQDYIDRLLGVVGVEVYRHRLAICIFCAALGMVTGTGFFMLRVNDSWVEMFPHKSDTYISNNLICERLNGTAPLNIVIEGDEADTIKSPSILRKIDAMQGIAEEADAVGGSISISDYIKRMNKVMNADSEEFSTVPDTREAIAQYLLLYSISGDPDDFDEVVDYDYRQANVTIMMRDDHTAVVKSVVESLERYIAENFTDEPVKVNLTGYAYIMQVVIDMGVRGLLSSIAISILVVYVMTTIMFRSPAGGIFSILPITMAMFLNFGLMGMLGVAIASANSVTFAVAIGIGVDYAIHLVFKFQQKVAINDDLSEVIVLSLRTSGKAILFNAVVVTAGFLVLLTSSFTGHQIMGRLLALSMITSFLGSVTLLPAALCIFKPAFIFRGVKDPKC